MTYQYEIWDERGRVLDAGPLAPEPHETLARAAERVAFRRHCLALAAKLYDDNFQFLVWREEHGHYEAVSS